MIETGFSYLALLVLFAGGLKLLEVRSKHKFFEYVPAIVLLYLLVMLGSTFNVWTTSDTIKATRGTLKHTLLPAMIFLMLLKSDLREIKKLGGKMLLGFFAASITIGLGFIGSFAIFGKWLDPLAWKSFAALSGSWMGGTGNMAAIQGALNLPDSSMGYTLLIDSIDYSIWVMLLLALVPYGKIFNKMTGASTDALDKVSEKLSKEKKTEKNIEFVDMIFLLGLSLAMSSIAIWLSHYLPQTSFLTASTWKVIIVTITGVALAMTPIGKMSGSSEISNIMLYIIVALMASSANFGELTKAPIYILAGLVIILIHAILMFGVAKIFKLDLFTCGVASLANIGGVASAPILAAAYSEALIPVGVLMAMLGYIVGTGGGLLVGKVLSLIV
jgi:uncharacterized membrane protein